MTRDDTPHTNPGADLPEITSTKDLSQVGHFYLTCTGCRHVIGDVRREIVWSSVLEQITEQWRPIISIDDMRDLRPTRRDAERTLQLAHTCPTKRGD